MSFLFLGVVAGGLLSVALILGVWWWLRALATQGEARARALVGASNVELVERAANCFGFTSQGVFQARGNGCLLLSSSHLVFAMWKPARDVLIERARILGVDTATSHLGKTQLAPLLRVRFTNSEGVEDSVAWRLRDLAPWLAAFG